MAEEDRAKAAFSTPDGHYEPTVLMFGLCKGPAVYQRMMSRAIGFLGPQIATFFLDDVNLGGKTFVELITKFEQLLLAIRAAGLTIMLSKCSFGCEKVQFLGFTLTSEGCLYPGKSKTQAINDFPVPTNKHEVRRFVGLCSFFRRFVRNFSQIVRPINTLLKKDAEFIWSRECQESFEDLKKILTCEPVLVIFDPTRRTEVHTDASGDGIAAMLLQFDDEERPYLVYCVSRSLSTPEINYHSTKLELLAAVWSLNRLRNYLLGIHFTLVTDCTAVAHLKTARGNKGQFARWQELVSDFDFNIVHRSGVKIEHVDAFSRAPGREADETDLIS